MPPRKETDPDAHHGFLDAIDEDSKKKARRRARRDAGDEDELDLDHIL